MSQVVLPVRRDSRLPASARWLCGALAVLVLAGNTVVLLSDRAPGLLRRLSDRLDVSTLRNAAAQAPPPGRSPESDFMVHVALWALATALACLAMGATWSKVVAAGTVLAYSVAVEVAQGVYTFSRSPQWDDLVANAVGVAAGLASAVAVGFLLWCRPPRRAFYY